MKKIFHISLLVALVVAFLTSCAAPTSTPTPAVPSESTEAPVVATEIPTEEAVATVAPIEPFTVGMPFGTSTDPTMASISKAVSDTLAVVNGTTVSDPTFDWTPDGMVTSAQKLIDMGVKGLMIYNLADSVLPRIDQIARDANVPWVLMSPVLDPEVQEVLDASPVYAGLASEFGQDDAYKSMQTLHDLGVKNLAVLTCQKGNTYADNREVGIDKGVSEFGIKILSTSRDLTTTADVTKTVESLVAAFPEMDGIFISCTLIPDTLPATMKVLEDHNLTGKVKVGRIDSDTTMGEYFEKGELSFVYGAQQEIKYTVLTALLINKILGTPLSDKPVSFTVPLSLITSSQDVQNYMDYFVNGSIYTPDEIKTKFLKYYTPDVTTESIQGILDNFSINEVVERHKQ